MSWIGKLLGSGVSEVADAIGGVVDRFHTSDEERAKAKLEIEKILEHDRERLAKQATAELKAKEAVILAEINSEDKYVSRHRPTIGYLGMAVIIFNYAIIPLFMPDQKALSLPEPFWLAWGSVVGIYSLGRSAEKMGLGGKLTTLATGKKDNKKSPSLLTD